MTERYDVWLRDDYPGPGDCPDCCRPWVCEASDPQHAAEMFAWDHDIEAEAGETIAEDGHGIVVVVRLSDQPNAEAHLFEVSGELEPAYYAAETEWHDADMEDEHDG